MSFRVEGKVEEESVFNRFEKLFNLHLYVLYQVLFFTAFCLAKGCAQLSRTGFHFSYELEQDEKWVWFRGWKWPRYGLERKD